ncbi:MAG: hypothetical protein WAN53_00420, partial [Candidatus Bathyarchaeia archaeon]
ISAENGDSGIQNPMNCSSNLKNVVSILLERDRVKQCIHRTARNSEHHYSGKCRVETGRKHK